MGRTWTKRSSERVQKQGHRPVDLRILQADANVTPPVCQKLMKAAPANTMLVALADRPMHYVMADAVYPVNSYQVTAIAARQGCAEQGFINSALELVTQDR